MSLNVLVIPEDSRTDQYIAGPVIESAIRSCGRPNCNVRVLSDPILGGIDAALNKANLAEIVDRYPTVQLFILAVDRDGDESRRALLDQREKELTGSLAAGQGFLAIEAWQEIEVWGLAGQRLPGLRWSDIRAERDPKEIYFEPFVQANLDRPGLGGGRRTLGIEAARRYGRVRQRCPELSDLEERVSHWLGR